MKNYEQINELCGIAKIKHENKEFYVFCLNDYGLNEPEILGECIAKGDTKIDCLKEVLNILVKELTQLKSFGNKMHNLIEDFIEFSEFNNVVVPMKNRIDPDDICNAYVCKNEWLNEARLCIC